MQLITVILLLIAIYVIQNIYKSYNNIVKELKEIKDKCVKEGMSTKEAFTSHINNNYVNTEIKKARDGVINTLKTSLKNIS